MRRLLKLLPVVVWAVAGLAVAPAMAQKQSVNPGINRAFEKPDVKQFEERFEREGRDAFDHREEIIAAVNAAPGTVMADVGAGTGLFTRLFAKQVGATGKVFAVDIADEFVDHVVKTAREAGLENVAGVVCAQDDVRLAPQSVDLVFICDTYHHFEFPHETMRSIHRALKPGGEVVLIDFERIEGKSDDWVLGHVRAGQEVFSKEIEEAGFRQIDEKKGLLDESYFVRFKRVDE